MLNQFKVSIFSLLILSVPFLTGCKAGKMATTGVGEPIKELRFLGEYIIPYNQQFKNTTVGGLSGIDYDKNKNVYYIISDDWSQINPARFYTARIYLNEKGIDSVVFINVTPFLQADGKVYPNAKEDPFHTPDPEALRYNPVRKNIVWTSEGERLITKERSVLQDPAIRIITKEGKFMDSFPLPLHMHMHSTEKGPRRNGVFEGVSFADGYKNLYVSVEEPVFEDGARAGTGDSTAWIRVLKYDANKRRLTGQYAYKVDPVVKVPVPPNGTRINGVSDILEIGKNKFLFIERSYSAGRTDCNIRVYIGDVSAATNIASVDSLKGNDFVPITKKLLFNMDALGMYIDNIEGVTLGPVLPNGNQALIFVADNNFRATEKAQLLLFEIVKK
jgi:hypothetical protein